MAGKKEEKQMEENGRDRRRIKRLRTSGLR